MASHGCLSCPYRPGLCCICAGPGHYEALHPAVATSYFGSPELSATERGHALPAAPRDCPHGHLYRKRIGLCAHCTEAELIRAEAERDELLAGVEAARTGVPTRETDIATVRDANALLRYLAERDAREIERLRARLKLADELIALVERGQSHDMEWDCPALSAAGQTALYAYQAVRDATAFPSASHPVATGGDRVEGVKP